MHNNAIALPLCALLLFACDNTSSNPGTSSNSNLATSSSSTKNNSSQANSSTVSSSQGTLGTSNTASSSSATANSSTANSSSSNTNPIAFQPCTIDVSKVGTDCGPLNPSSCDGVDIAMNYAKYPDPYAFFTDANNPGVTLLKGSACQKKGISLTWNSQNEQCILNGQGYPLTADHGCSSGKYASNVDASQYKNFVSQWYNIAMNKAQKVNQPIAGADAYVVNVKLEDGSQVQAALSMGHGVLDGKCGDAFLVKVNDKYVLLLQTDIRAWSLELSPGANTWLDQSNVGGTCIIPEVRKINAKFVLDQFQ